MADQKMSIEQLREVVRVFVDERDWQQFHSPKNLSMALSIEASELMEHFQWISTDESRQLKNDPSRKQQIEEELADVLCYTLAIANEMEIDLSEAMTSKMVKNRQKYPAAEFRGRYGPECE